MGNCVESKKVPINTGKPVGLDGKEKNDELNFKVVLLGDLYVGKTSILWRLIQNDFLEDAYSPTIGVAYLQKKIALDQGVQYFFLLNKKETGNYLEFVGYWWSCVFQRLY